MKRRVCGESRRVKRFERSDPIRRRGKASNFDKTTVEDGRSVGPKNCGKIRGKRAEHMWEIRNILPIGFKKVMGSGYQCLIM